MAAPFRTAASPTGSPGGGISGHARSSRDQLAARVRVDLGQQPVRRHLHVPRVAVVALAIGERELDRLDQDVERPRRVVAERAGSPTARGGSASAAAPAPGTRTRRPRPRARGTTCEARARPRPRTPPGRRTPSARPRGRGSRRCGARSRRCRTRRARRGSRRARPRARALASPATISLIVVRELGLDQPRAPAQAPRRRAGAWPPTSASPRACPRSSGDVGRERRRAGSPLGALEGGRRHLREGHRARAGERRAPGVRRGRHHGAEEPERDLAVALRAEELRGGAARVRTDSGHLEGLAGARQVHEDRRDAGEADHVGVHDAQHEPGGHSGVDGVAALGRGSAPRPARRADVRPRPSIGCPSPGASDGRRARRSSPWDCAASRLMAVS